MAMGVANVPLFAPTPSFAGMLREASGLLELPRLGWSLSRLSDEPRGDGSRVYVLPGFGTGDGTTWPLRRFLRAMGYDARGWGLGINRGEVPDLLEAMGHRVATAAADCGEPISLIGWSLGGYIAREVARDRPDDVRRVITFGSPVIGGPKYTTAAALADARGWDLEEIEAWVEERKGVALRVPTTAIYSRRDGVVAWPACVDPEAGAPIEHVEIDATHLGLGFNADVYRCIARRLALTPTSRTDGDAR